MCRPTLAILVLCTLDILGALRRAWWAFEIATDFVILDTFIEFSAALASNAL